MTTTTERGSSVRSPFADDVRASVKAANMHGECSVETFSSASGLGWTHEDADGFERFLNQYWPANFRFRDAGVQYWEYTEPYDDWQGLYGGDAVTVFYHSGHGTMDANGVFHAPLGAKWDGKDWVNSTQMFLGNERLRYAFWSTCLSLRVHDGHTPNRTWAAAAKGLRMIFGWETVSWDSPVYGRKFWEYWRAGNSFSTSWLKSGWDAGHDQAPSCTGIGASQAEAQNRVFGEKQLQFAAAVPNWWWWTWYDAARSASSDSLTATADVPDDPKVLRLGTLSDLTRTLDAIGPVTGVGDGAAHVELVAETDADRRSSTPLDHDRVLQIAEGVRSSLDLRGIDLEPHVVRTQRAAGSRQDGTETVDRHIAGYAVEYRQTVDGVRVISPESGYLRIDLDAAGQPLGVDVTARPVVQTIARPVLAPPRAGTRAGETRSVDALVSAAAAAHPVLGASATPVEQTGEVGYVTDGDTAYLAAQQGYLADFDHGLQKKVRITVPLNR